MPTGRIEITSQNHGFNVDADSLAGRVTVTHVNLNDGTVEGVRVDGLPAFSVQYHPEAGPGPHDAHYLFSMFAAMIDDPAAWRDGHYVPLAPIHLAAEASTAGFPAAERGVA